MIKLDFTLETQIFHADGTGGTPEGWYIETKHRISDGSVTYTRYGPIPFDMVERVRQDLLDQHQHMGEQMQRTFSDRLDALPTAMPDINHRVGEGTKFAANVKAVYNGEDWNAVVFFDDENMNFAKEIGTLPGSNRPAIFKHPWGIMHVGASGQVGMFRGVELWEQLCRLMQYASREIYINLPDKK